MSPTSIWRLWFLGLGVLAVLAVVAYVKVYRPEAGAAVQIQGEFRHTQQWLRQTEQQVADGEYQPLGTTSPEEPGTSSLDPTEPNPPQASFGIVTTIGSGGAVSGR
jgi:hypothetical protein